MKYGLVGTLFPLMFGKTVYEYTKRALPDMDIKEFKKKHLNEYKAMVERASFIGTMKENMFTGAAYLACYGLSYYKADPDKISMEVFDGMIDAVCKCDMMKRFYKGKDCFSETEINKYVQSSKRSLKRQYPDDWVF